MHKGRQTFFSLRAFKLLIPRHRSLQNKLPSLALIYNTVAYVFTHTMLKMKSSLNLVLGIIHDTHRSTDSTRSQQVSWPDVAAVDCVMGKLLLHGPVHVLQAEREMGRNRVHYFHKGGNWSDLLLYSGGAARRKCINQNMWVKTPRGDQELF